ncbi:hypothetical protein XU18_2530 [Perkinsela sp. CCAP 1560/4]|nr:hypothetical protein XU18_2530 [Perkinsela sp. CCAP 1560/4]|eukprot:KNH06629.1 hypothetical protein XU18_2530 [Perkinsela sp. CCAP 1560/4]
MHDPFRAHEAHRRAVDILFGQTSSIEKDRTLPDMTKLLREVARRDKYIALRTLQECFDGRRKVNHWFPVMEQMIHLIIELSADLKEFHQVALRSIEHYKKITQMNNVHSLHEVVFKFLVKIRNRLEEDIFITSSESSGIEELDQLESEQKLRSCSWTSKQNPSHAEAYEEGTWKTELCARRQFTSFYVESFEIYRALLYRFRGNLKLSTLFQSTIQQCAQLMLEYCEKWRKFPTARTAGFPAIKGNLQELLRVTRRHLDRLSRNAGTENFQNLSAKEVETRRFCVNSQEIFFGYIETWFKLFDIAKAAKLWSEAYIAVEAINYTLSEIFPRLQPRPAYIIRYYDALADVFWASNNCSPATGNPPQYLFHSYALVQLWKHLSRQENNMLDKEQYADLPGRILLAASCVYSNEVEELNGFDNSGGLVVSHAVYTPSSGVFLQNWTQLLGVKYPPTIGGLLRSIQSFQIVAHCQQDPTLVELYKMLRSQSSNSVVFLQQSIESINRLSGKQTYRQYLSPIQRNMTQTVLHNIFRCYHSITLEKMCTLACVPNYVQLEAILLKAINELRSKKFHIEVDQLNGACNFHSRGEEERVQTSISRVRVALATMQKQMIVHNPSIRQNLIERVKGTLSEERSQLLIRLDIVERRSSAQFFEKEAQRKKKLQEKQVRENEQKVLAAQQLEKERVQREIRKKQEEEDAHAREKIDELISELEKITGKCMPEIRSISDRLEVLGAATAMLHKEQQRVECEAVEEVNRYDFFIRAKREQEFFSLSTFWKKMVSQWHENMTTRDENERKNRKQVEENAIETRARLARMAKSRRKWENKIFAVRRQALESSRKKRMDEESVIENLMRGAGMQETVS